MYWEDQIALLPHNEDNLFIWKKRRKRLQTMRDRRRPKKKVLEDPTKSDKNVYGRKIYLLLMNKTVSLVAIQLYLPYFYREHRGLEV